MRCFKLIVFTAVVLSGSIATAMSALAAPIPSDYLKITSQAGVILTGIDGKKLEDFIFEADETDAADDNKVVFLNFKIEVPVGNFMNGDFPTSGVHFLERITGLLSDTIELMVVSTTPEKITFQIQMVSDGEKSNGDNVLPTPIFQAKPLDETGGLQDLTVLLFPKFYNPDGSETGKGPSPFRVIAASDLRAGSLNIPEPSTLALAILGAGLLGLGRTQRRWRVGSRMSGRYSLIPCWRNQPSKRR